MKEEVKYCEYCGVSSENKRVHYRKAFNKILCGTHYAQLNTFGKFLKRTEKDLNEIVLYENHAEIILYSKSKTGEEPLEKGRTLISLEDVDKVKHYKWKLLPNQYVYNYKVGLLSRFILGLSKGDKLEADHCDLNPLNNKRDNLRKATSKQQKQNQGKKFSKKTKSIYKGVSKIPTGKWLASIVVDCKNIILGRFEKEEDAAIAYNYKAIELFGEFAKLNIINSAKKEEVPF